MVAESKKGLGKGLSALFGDTDTVYVETSVTTESAEKISASTMFLEIDRLKPGQFQPRRIFDEDAIALLSESIKTKGILQPIIVRYDTKTAKTDPNHIFEIIAGERRWRAARKANLDKVPVIIHDLDDKEALEIALIENLQRQDLTPVEEAEGYKRLMDEFGHTQNELAESVGKSRSHIANTLRLLNLPEEVKQMIQAGEISMGHAKAIVSSNDPLAIARKIREESLTVRQTERLASNHSLTPRKERKRKNKNDIYSFDSEHSGEGIKNEDILILERDVSNLIGSRVRISPRDEDSGSISIDYHSLEQLDDFLNKLTRRS